MVKLGFPTFTVIGHDRGGRVSYRIALDHPMNVERPAVFDVIPILEASNRTDARFAQTDWPWILLAQEQRLPESYLLGAPQAVFRIPSGAVPLGRRFSKNILQPIAIRPACTASVNSIEPRQRSISNTIALTRKHRGESTARCCIFGLRVALSTSSMQATEVRSAFGGNGPRKRKDRR